MYEIFVSRRQGDSNGDVIKSALDRRFYANVAYLDVQSTSTGPLLDEIVTRIANAQFVLFVISRDWLGQALSPSGSANVLRFEIEQTFCQQKRFVPVLVNPLTKEQIQQQCLDTYLAPITNQLHVQYEPDGSKKEHRISLDRLFAKLEGGLPVYWRYVVQRNRRRFCQISAIIVAALMVLTAALFLGGYRAESPLPDIVYRHSYPPGPVPLRVRPKPPNVGDESTVLLDKHKNWMDYWLQKLQDGNAAQNQQLARVRPKAPAEVPDGLKPCYWQFVVSNAAFDRNYLSFPGAINVAPHNFLVAAFVFLVRNDGPETAYWPVYRQMPVNVDSGTPPKHSVFFKSPRRGESILIVALIRPEDENAYVDPDKLLITLEVH